MVSLCVPPPSQSLCVLLTLFCSQGPFGGKYGTLPYTCANYAQFTLDLLDRLGVDRFVVGGNSLGGEVAWHVAVKAPERVDKLILVDSAGYKFIPESMPIGFVIATIPVLNRIAEYAMTRGLIEASIRNVFGNPESVSDETIQAYYDINLRQGNRGALVKRFEAMLQNGSDQTQIATIKIPTLIL